MKKNRTFRLITLGFITWLIPFVVSFGFYDPQGNLNVSYPLFKCIMVVVSCLVGMWALLYHLKFVREYYLREGVVTGLSWLVINYFLDIVILVPMAKISIGQYFTTIGLGYLQIPIICIAAGMLLDRKIQGSY